MKIWITRHGQTRFNHSRLMQGLTDEPLNDRGIEQAERAREVIGDVRFDAVYSSPLIRAKQTASIIGGVEIPYEKGLLGHSDADVLLHAVTDALLGAAALGDIGRHFPDTDPRYKGIDSRILLRHAVKLLAERGYRAGNVDATVIAQKPKLAPYIDRMKENIAADLGVDPDQVNVKATTEERLGFTGREEGIAAHAVCLIEKADNSGGAD